MSHAREGHTPRRAGSLSYAFTDLPWWDLKLDCGHTKTVRGEKLTDHSVRLPQRKAACRECRRKYEQLLHGGADGGSD